MAGRTVAGPALPSSRWIVDRMELATGSLAGAGRPPVTASSFYGKGVGAASRVLARQASGQVSWAVHAEGGHSKWVTRVQFSDDGLQVISGSNDGTVVVSPILHANPAC